MKLEIKYVWVVVYLCCKHDRQEVLSNERDRDRYVLMKILICKT